MFALVVRFEVLPDHIEEFEALVAETVPEIGTREPGTVVYVTHRRPERPTERIFYECYEDETAFEAHESQEHTRRFLDQRDQHLAGPPEVWRLATGDGVIAGGGFGGEPK